MDANTAETDKVNPNAPFFTEAETDRINEATEVAESVRGRIFLALSTVQNDKDADSAVLQAKKAIMEGYMTTDDFQDAVDQLGSDAKGHVLASPELDDTVMPIPDIETVGVNEFDVQEAAYRGNIEPGTLNQAPQLPEEKAA